VLWGLSAVAGARRGSLYAYPREKSINHFKEQIRRLTRRCAPVTTQELIQQGQSRRAWLGPPLGVAERPANRRIALTSAQTDAALPTICFRSGHSTGCYNRSRNRLRPSVRTRASGAITLIASCSAARFS